MLPRAFLSIVKSRSSIYLYLHCKRHCLGMTNDTFGYPITAYRGLTTAPMNRQVVTDPGVLTELTKGKLPTGQESL